MLQQYKGEFALFIGTILASAGWFFSKFAIAEFPPVTFIGLRFLIAGLIFLPFAYHGMRVLNLTQLCCAGVVGLFFASNLITWIMALNQSNNLGEGAFMMSLSMLIAPIIAWVLFRDRPNTLFWFALPIAVLGLYFLVAGQAAFQFSDAHWLFFISSLSIAFYFVLLNRFAKQIPSLVLTTIMLLMVGIICTIYAYFTESWQFSISTETGLWVAASILIATNLRFLIQTIGQRYCSISSSAIIMLLEPIWTLFAGLLWLNETMSTEKMVGCGLILAALMIYRLPLIIRKKADNSRK